MTGALLTGVSVFLLVPRQRRADRVSDARHARLGRPVTAFIFVGFAAGGVDQRTLAQRIAEMPEVAEVFVASGEWDILLKARGESLESIGQLIVDKLRSMPGVARTMTATSFQTIKEEP